MHPTLRILGLILLAVAIQFLAPMALGLLAVLVVGAAWLCYRLLLINMVSRSRWLLLTVLLIFSLTTPGEYVHGWPDSFSPTYEGLYAGLMQAVRLIIMLAGLALLLGATVREELMAGIYFLLRPLRYLGLSAERFTARLWLTLHYVEQTAPRSGAWAMLRMIDEPEENSDSHSIELRMPAFSWRDGITVVWVCVVLMVWML